MKNTIKAVTLTTVLMFGATVTMAEGIIIGSRGETTCTVVEREGIIIGSRGIIGDILDSIAGIIIGSRAEKDTKVSTCEEKNGILVSDRAGILVSD